MSMQTTITEEKHALLGERCYTIRHACGLSVFLIPKELTTSYALFATKYGSLDNCFRRAGEDTFTAVPNGIAHFLEHKLFEAEDGSDAFARFGRIGANANAYTSFDKTAYLFSCTDEFEAALEVLLDFVTHPYFTEQTVQKEQGIIGQEINMCQDRPENALFYGLMRALYAKHPLRIDIAGTIDSIAKITPELLYRCYNLFYNLHNMVLCICGNVTPETVISVIDRTLGAQENPHIERAAVTEEASVCKSRVTGTAEVAKPLFAIGIKDIAIPTNAAERAKRRAAISVLFEMLFSESGTFYNDLYERGLIGKDLDYSAELWQDFSFGMLSGESDTPEAVFTAFCDFITKTRKEGLSQEDFERFRHVLYAAVVKSFDSVETVANNLLDIVLDGATPFATADALASLTFADVSALFDSYFQPERYAMSVIAPQKGAEA